MTLTPEPYGQLPNGGTVTLFTLTNSNGMIAKVMDFGATLTELHVPDRSGKLADVVLGKDSLDAYLAGHPCFGSTCGRVAGRIGNARFEIEETSYPLEANDGPNCLHGGLEGFHTLLWHSTIIKENDLQKLRLSLIDPDGHNGFPGNLQCSVTYSLLDDNSLQIEYQATTDQTTPLNLTNHSYFNLNGRGDVLNHEVQILADDVATVDEQSTLIGRRDPVVPGYNDYGQPVRLSSRERLEVGNADIHYFLRDGRTEEPTLAAVIKARESGRQMEVLTTEPGIQFYASNCLSDETGKGGVLHQPHDALCLETQDYADSINYPEMGGAILKPGQRFESKTLFRFSNL